jgi:hypothetical protein
MKVVQERLGHRYFAVAADIYSHVRPDLPAKGCWLVWRGIACSCGPKSDISSAPQLERGKCTGGRSTANSPCNFADMVQPRHDKAPDKRIH